MSSTIQSEAFLEFSKFFRGDLRIHKNLLVRFSSFQHFGCYRQPGFLSCNFFNRCHVRHVYLLLCRHCAYCSNKIVSRLRVRESDNPVYKVEERLKFLGSVAPLYSKAQMYLLRRCRTPALRRGAVCTFPYRLRDLLRFAQDASRSAAARRSG